MVVVQRQNNMEKGPFKLKGFSGFGDGTSPLKNIATSKTKSITPDGVLLEAAGLMGRGLDEPTSIKGMAALGFISGLSKKKPKTQSEADKKQQDKEKKEKKEKKKKEKKEKEKKPVITVELPEVTEIDGEDAKGKTIIQRIFKRKKKK